MDTADNTPMSWSLLLAKSPKPKPKGTGNPGPSDAPTHKSGSGGTSDSNTDTHNPNLIHDLGGWLIHHPIAIPILAIAALIGINVGWMKFRQWRVSKGMPTRGLGAILRDQLKFGLKEDNRPLHTKTPWLTGKRLYWLLFATTIATAYLPLGVPFPIPLLTLIATFISRYNKVAKARYAIVRQMFDVANGEIRYPKGAELNPWAYVNVTNWTNLIQPGQTVVTITAAYQSEDMKTRERFERNFNGTVSEENAWTYKWESAKNRIICQPAAFLPNLAPYPGPGDKWDEIPVGVKGDATQAVLPLSVAPHALVCGPTGSGKSVLQRMILFHVLAHEETWRVVAIDMKKVELAWLRNYPQVLKVATDLEEAVEVLRSLRAEMMRRYEEMEAAGVNHAKDLPDPPKALMCMIDEATVLLAAEGIKSDEGKERDELHAEAQMIIGELGRLSRASMIHVIMCFQRPDAKYLSGEIKANFDLRIAAGRMDTTPSLMVLDSEAANRLPKVKGRGMIRIGGELDTFQGFFAEQSWYDDWLAQQQGPVPDGPATPVLAKAVAEGPDGQVDEDGPDGVEAAAEVVTSAGRLKRRGGGIKALAAKAAAKAEARAARLDAEAAAEGAGEVSAEAATENPVVSKTDAAPTDAFDPADLLDVSVDLDGYMAPPSFDDDEDDDFDEDDFDEDLDDVEAVDEVEVDPAPVVERPVIPQPVMKPSPESALPAWWPELPGAEQEGPDPEPDVTPEPAASPAATATPVAPSVRPAGLPVQRPKGLPTRPPSVP